MSDTRATTAGTATYAASVSAAPGHFRSALGLTLSSIGLGTYLGRDDEAADAAYHDAIVAAVRGGVNVLDSAVNYRLERSERAIGRAIATLAREGTPREALVVATKGGYVPAPDPEAYFATIVARGLARREDLVAGCHSMAPGYLRHQLATSLANLGLAAVDVYYVHNPEQQLEEVDRPEFLARLRAAFEALEAEADAGRIGVYGTATWNGYRVPADDPGALSLEAVVGLAREVAGDRHRFRVVQLPFNLAMAEAHGHPTQVVDGAPAPFLEAAARLGVTVMTSASILQGRLARHLPPAVSKAFPGLATDAQRALQFARSTPGVTTALVGMGRLAHVEENLRLVGFPPASPDAVRSLFREA